MLKYRMLNIANDPFYEKINLAKLNYMRRADKNYNAYAVFQKIRNSLIIPDELEITKYGLIKVEYSKGRNLNNIGRW